MNIQQEVLKRNDDQSIAFKTITTFQDSTIEYALLVQEFRM